MIEYQKSLPFISHKVVVSPTQQQENVQEPLVGWKRLFWQFWHKNKQLRLTLILFVSAVICFTNGWERFFEPHPKRESTLFNLLYWLIYEGGTYVVGGIFCGILMVMLVRHLYRCIINDSYYWRTACPSCKQNNLSRIQRSIVQRIAGKLSRLPIRNYVCGSCNWRGLRIDQGVSY